MMSRLQNKVKTWLRRWLGITAEMDDVWLCIQQLQSDVAPKEVVEEHGGVVQATRAQIPYIPEQKTGNVVVEEPKLLSIERGRREAS